MNINRNTYPITPSEPYHKSKDQAAAKNKQAPAHKQNPLDDAGVIYEMSSVGLASEHTDWLKDRETAKAKKNKEQKIREENELRDLKRQLEQSNEQAEAAGEAFDSMAKCLLIASRIIAGDTVPVCDEKFLLENNPDLYGKAMTMRIEKKDPKEYDALTEEESESFERADTGSGSETTQETEPIQDSEELPAPPAGASATDSGY